MTFEYQVVHHLLLDYFELHCSAVVQGTKQVTRAAVEFYGEFMIIVHSFSVLTLIVATSHPYC